MNDFQEIMNHPAEALVKLDRKLSRALNDSRGMKFTAEDLDLLASIGVIEIVAKAKAAAIEDQARLRQQRRRAAAGIGQTTSPPADAAQPEASGLRRAQQLFGSRR